MLLLKWFNIKYLPSHLTMIKCLMPQCVLSTYEMKLGENPKMLLECVKARGERDRELNKQMHLTMVQRQYYTYRHPTITHSQISNHGMREALSRRSWKRTNVCISVVHLFYTISINEVECKKLLSHLELWIRIFENISGVHRPSK